jgi:carboxyl-terminal processing protease
MKHLKTYNKIKLCLLVVFVGFIASCQKDYHSIANTPSNFNEIFETFWNKMNTNYVYWDIDTTSWDAMYKKYKPIFAQLDLDNISDIRKSVQYFTDMTKGLIDGHYYISFSNPAIANLFVYPSYDRKKMVAGFHYPYYYFNIDTSYLDSNYSLGHDYNSSFNGQPLTTLSGTIENKILFFSCTNFSLLKSYQSKTKNGVQATLQYFFNTLANLSINIKGIIIDVRGNLGGDLSDLNFLVGHLIDKPLHFGYT